MTASSASRLVAKHTAPSKQGGTPVTHPIATAIDHAVLIRAPRERVYDAFTTAEGLDAWFTDGTTIDALPGGYLRFRWRDWGPDGISGKDGGPVLEATRPARFAFRWHGEARGYESTIEVDFEDWAGAAVVRLREHGYSDTPEGRWDLVDCAVGWGGALSLLKFSVEHGRRY